MSRELLGKRLGNPDGRSDGLILGKGPFSGEKLGPGLCSKCTTDQYNVSEGLKARSAGSALRSGCWSSGVIKMQVRF